MSILPSLNKMNQFYNYFNSNTDKKLKKWKIDHILHFKNIIACGVYLLVKENGNFFPTYLLFRQYFTL